MNLSDYKSAREEIEAEASNKIKMLTRDFCLGNNSVNIGDTVRTDNRAIIVDEIKFSSYQLCCLYFGVELTKKMKKRADGRRVSVSQRSPGFAINE